MALSAGDICAIVFGVYSLIITILFIALLFYFIKQVKSIEILQCQARIVLKTIANKKIKVVRQLFSVFYFYPLK